MFFATAAYFWGQLSVYHTPDHAFIADQHDPAYYKCLLDPGIKRRSQKIRSAPQIRAWSRRREPCRASRVVPHPVPSLGPCTSRGRAGLIYVLRPCVRCGAGREIFALPRPEANTNQRESNTKDSRWVSRRWCLALLLSGGG